MRETGIYQTLGDLDYFIPHPLPPLNPSLSFDSKILELYGEASFALGQLNEMTLRLPDEKRFIKAYVIKEALLSSAIEGIHTTLADVFSEKSENANMSKDTQLVLNYTKALESSLKMLTQENFPLVSRVILKAHEELLSSGEGDKMSPGSYRKQSVRVGDLIPPPAPEIPRLISELEKYMNEDSSLPPLIRAGLVHVHFETIHPFLDGNGRIGRLLIVLMLIHNKLLNLPIIYPSYYFKKHHLEYYQRLDRVRTHGDFEGWITYYLQAIRDSSLDAYNRAKEIEQLEMTLKQKIHNDPEFAKMRELALLSIEFLFSHPITEIAYMSKNLDKHYNSIDKILEKFVNMGIVSQSLVNKRNKLYHFDSYLNLLEKDYS
jgi:Fic family protein